MLITEFLEKSVLARMNRHPVPVPGKKVRQKTGSKYNELDM